MILPSKLFPEDAFANKEKSIEEKSTGKRMVEAANNKQFYTTETSIYEK